MKLIKDGNTLPFDKHKIKAVLIDSGRVLNAPVTGHNNKLLEEYYGFYYKRSYN